MKIVLLSRLRKKIGVACFAVLMAAFMMSSRFSYANSCSAVFPDAATAHSSGGSISFGEFSEIYDSDTILDIAIGTDLSTRSCRTATCTYSGSPAASFTLPSFNFTNSSQDLFGSANANYTLDQGSYDDLTMEQNTGLFILDRNIESRFDTVTIGDNSDLVLANGVYWINTLELGNNATIIVNEDERAIVYVNNFILGSNLRFNINGSEDQLTIVAMNSMAVDINTQMRGYYYINNDFSLGDNSKFYGSVTAQNISLGQSVDMFTRLSGLTTAKFDGLCDQNQTLPQPFAYYSMDMCSVSTGSAAVSDDIGSADADLEGSASIDFSGKYCQALYLNGDKSYLDIPDPFSGNLPQGSISFYFKTPDIDHSNSSSAGAMTLLSRDRSNTDSAGHLSLWLSDSGALYARQQSATTSYDLTTTSSIVRENTWHHVVYTWGPSGMQIYLDGSLRASRSDYTGGFVGDSLPLAVGANAWQFNPNNSTSTRVSQLRDFFLGSVDEIRIYDEQLEDAQVAALEQLSSQTCTSCTSDPQIVAHWGADVCSISQNQLIDVEGGMNAVAQNGVGINFASRFCQGMTFDGSQSYATVEHDSRLQIASGAISMWFKIPDLSHSNNSGEGGNALISKDSLNFKNGGHLEARVSASGTIEIRHQTTTSSKFFNTGSTPVVEENKWHHFVYSFGANGASIYVDGVERYSDPTYTNGLATNDEVLVFGATGRVADHDATSASNFRDFLQGELDHIKFYRNQPNGADVQQWFTETPSQCVTCDSVVAQYSFDEANAQTGVVEDISGNGNDATLGSNISTSILSDNIACRAMETSTSTSSDFQSYALDTGLDVATDIGTQGTIAFWYRAKDDWDSGTARQLFDASNSTSSKYFFLVRRADGSLRFALEDSDDSDVYITTSSNSFAADTWVHIAVKWNLELAELAIYINGQEQNVTVFTDSLLTPSFPVLDTLVFGDNRSTYNVNGSSSNSSNGYIDEIKIYSQSVSDSTITQHMSEAESCAIVNNYLIEHPDSALTCDGAEVVIKACTDATCSELSSLPSTIVLTPDQFSPASSITFTGQTTLTLTSASPGEVTIGSSSQDPIAPVNCDNNCLVDFESVGIQFFNRITGQSNFSATPFIAQNALSDVGIRIVGANSSGVCEGVTNGNVDIDLSYQCVQTASVDYTPTTCNVPFAGIPLSGGLNNTGSISLEFNSDGESDFSAYNFADAGILRLSASATVNSTPVQSATTDLSIVPDSLVIAAAADSNLSPTNTAGSPFALSITAVGSQGATLPGFQSNELQLSAQRLIPSNFNAVDSQFYVSSSVNVTTSISENFGSVSLNFINGVANTNTAYMEEVGTYKLVFRDANYLGSVISANEVTLGRFIPAYFDVQQVHQPSLDNTCNNSFTYLGEDFSYTPGLEPSVAVTAYNSRGQITRNYTDTLWRLTPNASVLAAQTSITDNSVYSSAIIQSSAFSNISVTGTEIYDGRAVFTATGAQYTYPKIVNPTGADASPFNSDFDLSLQSSWFTDADNVCYQSSYPSACDAFTFNNISGANMRYGRLNLANVFGPETESLFLPVYTEYLDAGQWRVNTEDNCTAIVTTQNSSDVAITHDAQSPVDITSFVGTVSINGSMVNGVLPVGATSFGPYLSNGTAQSGSFFIELLPVSAGNHWSNHLNYDWDGDGDIDANDNPSANLNFGIYRGNERTLHWREVLN